MIRKPLQLPGRVQRKSNEEILSGQEDGDQTSVLTSSTTVYAMCWLRRRFCKTAKILRAPRRALDRPIIFAAKSVKDTDTDV